MRATPATIPAPVGGLNTRDALANMNPLDAVSMVNLFPTPTSVDLRKGISLQATLTTGGGATLTNRVNGFVRYGDQSLWAVANTVTPSGLVEDVVAGTELTFSPLSTNIPDYAQFANTGGVYVAAVFRNSDATHNYYTYDGTNWVARTATTTGAADFRTVTAYRNRLWFTKGTLSAFYLPTAAITGTPVEFSLGGVAWRGGTLSWISTWTLDGGVGGTDDLIVFVTSNGQAIVYQGTDPSNASTFGLIGVFDISKPVGKPLRYGTDLLLPLEDGLYSMAEILRGNTGSEYAVSAKIRSEWQALAAMGFGGITMAYSAKLNCIMANFATTAFVVSGPMSSTQLVMNTISKAWTKFTGLNCYAIDSMQGDIYLGQVNVTTGVVYKFGTALSDLGAAIVGYALQAYNYLAYPMLKQATLLQPSFKVAGNHTVGFAIDPDFQQALTTSSTPTNEAVYGTGTYSPPLSYPVVGDALGVFCEVSSSVSAFSWYSTRIFYNRGVL